MVCVCVDVSHMVCMSDCFLCVSLCACMSGRMREKEVMSVRLCVTEKKKDGRFVHT